MINEYMELAFDTNSESFTEMAAIIGAAMFRKKFDDCRKHHIVPITYFAQNDEQRPEWASVSDWGDIIRKSPMHIANQEWNQVFLTEIEHNKVHELMQKCSVNEWSAPSTGKYAYKKIQRLDRDTLEVVEEYDTLTFAAEWCVSDNPSLDVDVAYREVRIASLPHNAGVKVRYGFLWKRV